MKKRISGLLLVLFAAPLWAAVMLHSPAPRFSLPNLQGQKKSLMDYRGRVVFINFWASWCAPCRMELPELNRLAAAYSSQKVRVLTINVEPNKADASRLLKDLGLDHPAFEVLLDNHSRIVSAYNIDTMPSSIIVDQNGIARFTHSGFHPNDPETWRKEIGTLLH